MAWDWVPSISGFVAGTVGVLVSHPFDTVKPRPPLFVGAVVRHEPQLFLVRNVGGPAFNPDPGRVARGARRPPPHPPGAGGQRAVPRYLAPGLLHF